MAAPGQCTIMAAPEYLSSGQSLCGEFRSVSSADVSRAFALEIQSYPPDEAATLPTLTFRQQEAGNLFLGYFENSVLLAYVCGTRYYGPTFRKESMYKHIVDADCVCIHSVVVEATRCRQGIGSKLLMKYISHVHQTEVGVKLILLLTKDELRSFYSGCGFTCVGKSTVEHGRDVWYEMQLGSIQ